MLEWAERPTGLIRALEQKGIERLLPRGSVRSGGVGQDPVKFEEICTDGRHVQHLVYAVPVACGLQLDLTANCSTLSGMAYLAIVIRYRQGAGKPKRSVGCASDQACRT